MKKAATFNGKKNTRKILQQVLWRLRQKNKALQNS